MSDSIGLLICGHGSRDPQAQVLFGAWAEKLRQRAGFTHGETGFMEIAKPTLADAARALVKKGLEHIIVIPGFIMGAAHTTQDIPVLLRELEHESLFKNVRIDYAHRIANHPLLLQAANARIQEALNATDINLARSHLLVVAHGSSDVQANNDIVQLTQKLQSALNTGAASSAFSNVCSPRVEDALAKLVTNQLDALVVLPYFLLPSYPVRQLYSQADQFAAQHPRFKVLKAHCLDDHPSTLDAFVDVLQQTLKRASHD